jgi:hypothetical protein
MPLFVCKPPIHDKDSDHTSSLIAYMEIDDPAESIERIYSPNVVRHGISQSTKLCDQHTSGQALPPSLSFRFGKLLTDS